MLSHGADAEVRYELHDGVFKRIALRAAAAGLQQDAFRRRLRRALGCSDPRPQETGGAGGQGPDGKTYQIEVHGEGNIHSHAFVRSTKTARSPRSGMGTRSHSRDNARLFWEHRDELGPEPEKITYSKSMALFSRERGGRGGNHYTALWIVYCELLAVRRSMPARKLDPAERLARAQAALDNLAKPRLFAFTAQTPQFVLIIDEINRGNISKILGELITLLEPDKRLTAKNELRLPLSYSPEHRFAVPPNLHILGTMNTADRSIALMDVALRRRFWFEELMPDQEVIRKVLTDEEVPAPFVELVVDLFTVINERIRFLYDRDHQIGHAYFLEATDSDALRMVLCDRIIPMLQELLGAWDNICVVLGCPYTTSGMPKRKGDHLLQSGGRDYAWPIVLAQHFGDLKSLELDQDDEDRVDYRVQA